MDLIIETALTDIRIALLKNGILQGEKLVEKGRGEILDSLTQELFAEVGICLDDIKRILVTQGPGSFTGLRTGMAFAQGLCFTGKRRLFGVSTLAALATLASSDSKPCVILKAKPGFYYVGYGDIPKDCLNMSREGLIGEEELEEWTEKCDLLIADFNETPLENIKTKFENTIALEKGFSLESMVVLLDIIPILDIVKPNYLQKSYAEQQI